MGTKIIVTTAAMLLGGLLFFERRKRLRRVVICKTVLSFLFIVAALVQPHQADPYYILILAGLGFCFVGDVLLANRRSREFLFGVGAFAAGHVTYSLGFFSIGRLQPDLGLAAVVVLIISGTVYFRLQPYLGKMRGYIIIYILVISVMVVAAWSVTNSSDIPVQGRSMIVAGALLFYCSDLFVARERFVKHGFINRLIGLPLYYAGQFFLAFSPRFIG
ncbi:MAG: lysoplasmalogenase [Deltaproteobacteria bacterium]|nr:lysoplasmalogenase [Deltaproteobacteria bacterium]MBN2688645.1 lysoplasmalogenase [Deltaproteobacteria bacterium]